jgi:hypothetical protein
MATGKGVLRQLHRGRPQIRSRPGDHLLEYGVERPDDADDGRGVREIPPPTLDREYDRECDGQDRQRQRVGEIGEPDQRVLVLRSREVMELDQAPPLAGERTGMDADPDRQRDERDAGRTGAPP